MLCSLIEMACVIQIRSIGSANWKCSHQRCRSARQALSILLVNCFTIILIEIIYVQLNQSKSFEFMFNIFRNNYAIFIKCEFHIWTLQSKQTWLIIGYYVYQLAHYVCSVPRFVNVRLDVWFEFNEKKNEEQHDESNNAVLNINLNWCQNKLPHFYVSNIRTKMNHLILYNKIQHDARIPIR